MQYLKFISKKQFSFIIVFIIIALLIILIPFSFSAPQPVKSVTIQSEKLDYMQQEPGSWKITKSAEWVGSGIAEITFDLDTVLKSKTKYTDVIFVLDISGSMSGDKIERVKQDSIELIHSVLSNSENRVALITFATESQILSEFTNYENDLVQKISSLSVLGYTNYYQAFVNVNQVLQDYVQQDDCETLVLFLTDGYPTVDTPNEVSYFEYLKQTYPFITVNAIQYEMGEEISDSIKNVSDNQYVANMETLNNVLFQASVTPIRYDNFDIVDYIDSRYFKIESSDDIEASIGSFELEYEGDTPKISWHIDHLNSGSSAQLKIRVKLLDQYLDAGNVYPTNEKEVIQSTIDSVQERVESSETPSLANKYQVMYDANAPDGCSVSNVPDSKQYSVYDTVEISSEEPVCNGYQFKGWEIVTDVEKVNDDYFIMPESDVILRGVWSQFKIAKSMDGTIFEIQTLYKMMQDNSVLDNVKSEFVSSSNGINFFNVSSNTNGKGLYEFASSKNQSYPIYYYRGDIDNNNVKFANFCWKIVRTTDTGGVKIVYNGTPSADGSCNPELTSTTLVGSSTYYQSYDSISDVGYMYGNRYPYSAREMDFDNNAEYVYGNDVTYSNGVYTLVNTKTSKVANWETERDIITGKDGYHYTCFTNGNQCSEVFYIYFAEQTFVAGSSNVYFIRLSDGKKVENVLDEMTYSSSNINNSSIKESIDSWFSNNLIDYMDMIEDTVWCNDRSIFNKAGWDKDGDGNDSFIFSAFDRLLQDAFPSFTCSNINDSFTVNDGNGNGKLTYPVGLLTADEVVLAGGGTVSSNANYYLNNQQYWWTMTPFDFTKYNVTMFVVRSDGMVNNYEGVGYTYGIRPAISLKNDVIVVDGDGSQDNPFVVE